MPEIRPFKGVRYAGEETLKPIVCPPYDVISPEQQRQLHELHPHNAVRIELPFSAAGDKVDRYRKADEQFRAWLAEGVLAPDDTPALYVYRQDYELPGGTRGRVAGVMGALVLEEFGAGAGVLPHERTMPGPIEDRLALIRACPVNISPIYAIYRGAGGLAPFLDSLENRPPEARFAGDAGTLQRLWRISAPAEIEMLAAALAPGPLVIADGHHRYETALAYHRERGTEPGGHDAVMCFCVDADVEGLVVAAFHRAIQTDEEPAVLKTRLLEAFGGKELTRDESAGAQTASGADHPLVVRFPDGDVLVELSDEQVTAATGDRAAAWRRLDVVALHEVVLPRLFPDGPPQMVFTRETEEIDRLMSEEGWPMGVLLRAPNATDVIDVASTGERMPQKASYFWPKALTGLVFRSLND